MFVKKADMDLSIPKFAFAITFSYNSKVLAIGKNKKISLYNLNS